MNFANADGRTPLHLAVARGRVDMARFLVDAGADMHRCDRWQQSPLSDALRTPDEPLCELLVRRDASRKDDEFARIMQEPVAFAIC